MEFRAKIGTTRTNLEELSQVMDKIGVISSNSPRRIAAINAATRKAGYHEALAKTAEASAMTERPPARANAHAPVLVG